MINKSVWILVLGIIFIIVGVGGNVYAGEYPGSTAAYCRMDGYSRYADGADTGYSGTGPVGCGFQRGFTVSSDGVPNSVDTLTGEVEHYIAGYDIELTISDIFIFADSDYYYSIVEAETGKGAMELLVNPYTAAVFPEHGPNRMWNLKYGISQYRRNMGRGMMKYYNYDNESFYYHKDYSDENDLTHNEAYNKAMEYLADKAPELTVGEEYHEFYGYFTFHVNLDGGTVGMLSVNGFTGAVWYHGWHGEVVDILDKHDEEGH